MNYISISCRVTTTLIHLQYLHAFFLISITFISIPSMIFDEKIKHNASLNLRYELKFFFEFNQSTTLEL